MDNNDFFFYLLHWIFVICAIVFSWVRSRHYLHPHFMFTLMLVVLLSDFLVRGYNDKNLISILRSDVYLYQIIILTILSAIVFTTSFVRSPRIENRLLQFHMRLYIEPKIRRLLYIIVLVLLAADILKRFSMANWSINEVVRQSLSVRGQRDWDQAAYSGNFVFSLTTILLPLGAVALAYLIVVSRGINRIVALTLFTLTIAVLVTNGSRTPVTISFASLAIFAMIKQRNLSIRIVTLSMIISIWITLISAMALYRATGYQYANKPDFEINYHQDDSYYRAIFAYAYADRTGESWDPIFFTTAIIVNPIPRVIWPNKPLLTAEFFGGFKLDYVTNSFLGEIVAMTGVSFSILVAPLIGHLLYLIFFNAQRLFRYSVGLVAYLLVALYIYMCIRSLMGLVHYVYLPLFSVIIVIALNKMKKNTYPLKDRPSKLTSAVYKH